jgi:hypothetical protein
METPQDVREELERTIAKIRACPHTDYKIEANDQVRFEHQEIVYGCKCKCGLFWSAWRKKEHASQTE